jgi:hypothetical protein
VNVCHVLGALFVATPISPAGKFCAYAAAVKNNAAMNVNILFILSSYDDWTKISSEA